MKKHRRKILLVLVLCLIVSAALLLTRRKEAAQANSIDEKPFILLIMGDSQMAGYGWTGGYGNCLSEVYPNATLINLAQSGALLANGEIHAQWDFYLAETDIMPDYVLLDGGINDLSYLKMEKFPEGGFRLASDAMCALIEHIHTESPDTKIIYVAMPPFAEWTEAEDGIPAYDIQEDYWRHMNGIAGAYEYVTVVDLFSIDPFGYPDVASYQKNIADSVHLSEAGYRNTFEYINKALETCLVK